MRDSLLGAAPQRPEPVVEQLAAELEREPQPDGARGPGEARVAVGVDHRRRQEREQGRCPRARSAPPDVVERHGEGEQEARHQRLLERALREVGGGEVGQTAERRGDQAIVCDDRFEVDGE